VDALTVFVAENSAEAYILYRELDYFEQLRALERHGGFDFELIRTPLGRWLPRLSPAASAPARARRGFPGHRAVWLVGKGIATRRTAIRTAWMDDLPLHVFRMTG
jgi:hypothetical protein